MFLRLMFRSTHYAGFVPKLIGGGRQACDEVAFKWLDCGLSETQSQKVIVFCVDRLCVLAYDLLLAVISLLCQ